MSLVSLLRRLISRWHVRPWALCAPILILILTVPLLRPLRTPDSRLISDDEQARLGTIQGIVENHTLAIEETDFSGTHDKITSVSEPTHPTHYYSNQPPMLAVLLSGPYWIMHELASEPSHATPTRLLPIRRWLGRRLGMTFAHDPNSAVFWLTLLGVTLPVALSAGLVYRMGRTFELSQIKRAVLALFVVMASGLVSYATVLNSHAPAAALILAAVACLVHVIAHNKPWRAGGWLALGGLLAALAATIDPPAVIFLAALVLVIGAIRWPIGLRAAGIVAYCLGAVAPVWIHVHLTRPITGDLRPGIFHPELAVKRLADTPDTESESPAEPILAADHIAGSGPDAPATILAVHRPFDQVHGTPVDQSHDKTITAQTRDQVQDRPEPEGMVFSIAQLTTRASSRASTGAADDDDEPLTFWPATWRGTQKVFGAFFGSHGVLSHFPILLLGILGVTLIMHRHWPAATKMLAGVTLAAALAIILFQALGRPELRDAMFATRWFVVFTPITLFWAGAWLRRPHRPGSWIMVGMLLAFSVGASILGATGPFPRDGFDRYTVAGALHNLRHHPVGPAPLADRGEQDAFAE